MSTGIHAIVQIQEDRNWQTIDYCPKELKDRDYNLFAYLANIRNYFNIQGFKPRGLPKDIKKQQRWTSLIPEIVKHYITDSNERVVMPDGSIRHPHDSMFEVRCKTEEEAKNYKHYSCVYGPEPKYLGYDHAAKNGVLTQVCIAREFPDFKEFIDTYYPEFKDKPVSRIGYYTVDFDCPDYYGHSYLLLSELLDSDKSGYTEYRTKIPIEVYHEFKRRDGVLPKGMHFIETRPCDLREALSEAYQPTIMVGWQPDEKVIAQTPLYRLIRELIYIKSKYNKTNEQVRIVFCFDN